jgi:hypothetical protein
MEKIMVQKHREQRCKKSGTLLMDRDLKYRDSRGKVNGVYDRSADTGCHGVKRSMSHSWEGDTHKDSKHTHIDGVGGGAGSWNLAGHFSKENFGSNLLCKNENFSSGENKQHQGHLPSSTSNVNLCPPFSITVTSIHNSQPYNSHRYVINLTVILIK